MFNPDDLLGIISRRAMQIQLHANNYCLNVDTQVLIEQVKELRDLVNEFAQAMASVPAPNGEHRSQPNAN
jgi:predicted ATP-grasp superfamily ATP-dependent carboligase